MRRAVIAFSLIGAAIFGGALHAQVTTYPPVTPDLSGYAKTTDIPTPATTIPPSETPGGAAGSAMTFRRGDAVQPRITRTATLTLAADGTVTFDWTAQGPLATPVQVVVTPIYTGSGVPKCWATAVTANTASVKCVIESVSLLSVAGINVGSITNTAPASMPVNIVALPKS